MDTQVYDGVPGDEVRTGVLEGVDFDFRPDYWGGHDPRALLTGALPGQPVPEFYAGPGVDPEPYRRRASFAKWKGAKWPQHHAYVDPLTAGLENRDARVPQLPGEVVIASIVVYGVLADVIQIRAWHDGARIHYGFATEEPFRLEGDTPEIVWPDLRTRRPLSFGELVWFVDHSMHGEYGSGRVPYWAGVLALGYGGGMSLDELFGFVLVQSSHYQQLESYYRGRVVKLCEKWREEYER